MRKILFYFLSVYILNTVEKDIQLHTASARDSKAFDKIFLHCVEKANGTMLIRPRSRCPRTFFLGRCAPWMMCPLDYVDIEKAAD
jgi:hypothetical protein